MKFQFNIIFNDNDYFEFNKFLTFRSHYGKKQMLTLRIVMVAFLSFFVLFWGGGFAYESFIDAIPYVVALVVSQLSIRPFLILALKSSVKGMKKRGKLGYSSVSVVEFYEDVLIETTPDNKIEQKYSSIERISIVDNKAVYIHTNSMMAYILPISCFESNEQYNEFLEFIATKCEIIERY